MYAIRSYYELIKQSGFLAQEVERAALESGYDFSGITPPKGDVKYYSLAYAEFVVITSYSIHYTKLYEA